MGKDTCCQADLSSMPRIHMIGENGFYQAVLWLSYTYIDIQMQTHKHTGTHYYTTQKNVIKKIYHRDMLFVALRQSCYVAIIDLKWTI